MGIGKRLSNWISSSQTKRREEDTENGNEISVQSIVERHSTPQASLLLSLPPEIIDYIASFCTNDLPNMALSCRALTQPAHRSLFANVHHTLVKSWEPSRKGHERMKDFLRYGTHLHRYILACTINHSYYATDEHYLRGFIQEYIKKLPNLVRITWNVHAEFLPPILDASAHRDRLFLSLRLPPAIEGAAYIDLSGPPIVVESLRVSSSQGSYLHASNVCIQHATQCFSRFFRSLCVLVLVNPWAEYFTALSLLHFPYLTAFSTHGGNDINEQEYVDSMILFLQRHSGLQRLGLDNEQRPLCSAQRSALILPKITHYQGSLAAFVSLSNQCPIETLQLSFSEHSPAARMIAELEELSRVTFLCLRVDWSKGVCHDLILLLSKTTSLEQLRLKVTFHKDIDEPVAKLFPSLKPVLSTLTRLWFHFHYYLITHGVPLEERPLRQLQVMISGVEEWEHEMGLGSMPGRGLQFMSCHFQWEYSANRLWRPQRDIDGVDRIVPFWDITGPNTYLR